MAIPNCLLKSIYIAYALGADTNGKMSYDEPIKIKAQVEDRSSYAERDDVGMYQKYDIQVNVPYNGQAQFIDEQTLLWVDVEPNENRSNNDYIIGRVGKVNNGNLSLYCNSTTANYKSIYYLYNDKVYQMKVDFNSSTLVALVPFNKYFPVTETTKVWTTKPSSIDSTKNLIQLSKKEKFGKVYKYTFVQKQ